MHAELPRVLGRVSGSDESCTELYVIRNLCIGTLTCEGYALWFGSDVSMFPCADEDNALYEVCFEPLMP